MIPALGALGYILAALVVGLWLGERGRRLDAQRREGVVPVDPPKPATVTPERASDHAAAFVPDEAALADAREKYIAEAEAEGFSAKTAAEDFDRMMATLNSDALS